MSFSREEKLLHINKSPNSVAIHDKEGWLSIFAESSIVEDPVGSKPHLHESLSRFYETFIAPNNIVFDVKNDIVCKDRVVRDLTVNIDMAGVSVSVPMHLLYELIEQNESLKINRLAAHWELVPMVRLLVSKGTGAIPAFKSMTTGMMRYQGLSGAMGFMSGVGKLGKQAKKSVHTFVDAFNGHDSATLASLFSTEGLIFAPYGKGKIIPHQVFDKLPGKLSYTKTLLAGPTVTVSVSYQPTLMRDDIQGVGVFEFDLKSKKIDRLTFYWE